MQQCGLLNIDELVYQSSEQYVILCLKICNLIIKYKCDINSLINNSMTTTSIKTSTTSKMITNSTVSNSTTKTVITGDNLFLYYYSPSNNNNDYHHPDSHYYNTSSNNTSSSALSLSSYSSITIQLLLKLNETECIKYSNRESHKLSLFIFGIILSTIILVLNGLTLTTIIRTRRLHTITNILIANLSLSDFLSGCSFLYPCILNLLTIYALETYNTYLYKLACNIRQYYYICLVGYSPMITSMLSSIFTLTLLAFEKYVAILKPYLFEHLCVYKNKLLPLLICLNWFISIIISMLPIMGWNEYHQVVIINGQQHIIHSSYRGFDCTHPQSMQCKFEKIFTLGYILLFTIICCICALTMLAIYIRIYLIARKHSKQIALQMTHVINFKKVNNQHVLHLNIPCTASKTLSTRHNYEIIDNNSINLEFENNSKKQQQQQQQQCDSGGAVSTSSEMHQSISLTTYVDLYTDAQNSIQQTSGLGIEKATETTLTVNKIQVSNNSSDEENEETLTQVSTPPVFVAASSSAVIPKVKKPSTASPSTATISTKSLNLSMKAMKTLLILLLGFYLCWLPLIIYFLAFASQKYDNLTINILMFVACCNAIIDPIVYAFRNREFYKALLSNFKIRKN